MCRERKRLRGLFTPQLVLTYAGNGVTILGRLKFFKMIEGLDFRYSRQKYWDGAKCGLVSRGRWSPPNQMHGATRLMQGLEESTIFT